MLSPILSASPVSPKTEWALTTANLTCSAFPSEAPNVQLLRLLAATLSVLKVSLNAKTPPSLQLQLALSLSKASDCYLAMVVSFKYRDSSMGLMAR